MLSVANSTAMKQTNVVFFFFRYGSAPITATGPVRRSDEEEED